MGVSPRNAIFAGSAWLIARAGAMKRHWRFPERWIQRWRDRLAITPQRLATKPCFAAADEGGEVLAFAAWCNRAGEFWNDHLWVLPTRKGRGIGGRRFERCEQEVRNAGVTSLRIEADPNAEPFYARMGAHNVGRAPVPIDRVARFLPVMEKALKRRVETRTV